MIRRKGDPWQPKPGKIKWSEEMLRSEKREAEQKRISAALIRWQRGMPRGRK